jgi:hypothetical protein
MRSPTTHHPRMIARRPDITNAAPVSTARRSFARQRAQGGAFVRFPALHRLGFIACVRRLSRHQAIRPFRQPGGMLSGEQCRSLSSCQQALLPEAGEAPIADNDVIMQDDSKRC